MIFFTSLLIVTILYYLQADGLIYVTIIALVAELINIFLTHTMTKSVEKKLKTIHQLSTEGYLARLKSKRKTIKELEKLQDEAGSKLYKASEKIKKLEEELENAKKTDPPAETPEVEKIEPAIPPQPQSSTPTPTPDTYNDLPDGSKR